MTTNYNIVWSGLKLDGKLDFNYWEKLMSIHLKAHSIWNFIEPADAKNAKDAWDKLKLSCKGVEKTQKTKLQSMRREYERYEMSNSETVEQYFSLAQDLVNKMTVYGEDISDGKVVEKILRTIPIKFDHVVTTIIETHDLDKMTVAELQGSIESHVSRILEKTEKVSEEALKSQVSFNNVVESSQSINERS
ncbi:unnamed protein product [Vicia faba]|uniref:Uncharacterized protein n=1 Tax=Vicia faba TaxID=3906 RepID=A0AAV0ZTI4_VICFA|nr:unnamed protein product [Vicia faba]